MAEFIERSSITNALFNNTSLEGYDLEEAVNAICAIPAADVRPVKRGKWVESFPLEVECTRCKFRVKSLLKIWYKFCPNCGADMREES